MKTTEVRHRPQAVASVSWILRGTPRDGEQLRGSMRKSAGAFCVEAVATSSSGAKIRDLRDMLTMLNHRQVKADKGRRKDLKKMESIVKDLGMLIENW
jgi:hypothetical protein